MTNTNVVYHLQTELQQESQTRQLQEDINSKLRQEHDQLLRRLAAAENHIDQLRLGHTSNVTSPAQSCTDLSQGGHSLHHTHSKSHVHSDSGDHIGSSTNIAYPKVKGYEFANGVQVSQELSQPPPVHELDSSLPPTAPLSRQVPPTDSLHSDDDLCISAMSASSVANRATAEGLQIALLFKVGDIREKVVELQAKVNEGDVSTDMLISSLEQIQLEHRALNTEIHDSNTHLKILNKRYKGKASGRIENELSTLADQLKTLHSLLSNAKHLLTSSSAQAVIASPVPPPQNHTVNHADTRTGRIHTTDLLPSPPIPVTVSRMAVQSCSKDSGSEVGSEFSYDQSSPNLSSKYFVKNDLEHVSTLDFSTDNIFGSDKSHEDNISHDQSPDLPLLSHDSSHHNGFSTAHDETDTKRCRSNQQESLATSVGPSQILVGSSQFPVGLSQFPTDSSQFPVGLSQFPAGSSQFPVSSSQFPVGLSQFPAGSSQFPVGLSQFPAGSSQFPVGLSQFPVGPSYNKELQSETCILGYDGDTETGGIGTEQQDNIYPKPGSRQQANPGDVSVNVSGDHYSTHAGSLTHSFSKQPALGFRSQVPNNPPSHTHTSHIPVTPSSHAHTTHTPVTHSSHAHTTVTQPLHAHTPVTHSSHTRTPHTPMTHSSYTHTPHTPVTPSSHAHTPHTPVTHFSHAHTTVTRPSHAHIPVTHSSYTHTPHTPVTHFSHAHTTVTQPSHSHTAHTTVKYLHSCPSLSDQQSHGKQTESDHVSVRGKPSLSRNALDNSPEMVSSGPAAMSDNFSTLTMSAIDRLRAELNILKEQIQQSRLTSLQATHSHSSHKTPPPTHSHSSHKTPPPTHSHNSHKTPPPTRSHNSHETPPSIHHSAKKPIRHMESVPLTTQTSRQLTAPQTAPHHPHHGRTLFNRQTARDDRQAPGSSTYTHTRHNVETLTPSRSHHHHTQSTNSSADSTPYHTMWNTDSSQSKHSATDSSRSQHSSAHPSTQNHTETKESDESKTSRHHSRFSNHWTTSSSSSSGLERSKYKSRYLGSSQDSNWVCPNCGGKGISNTSISPGGTRTHVHTHKCVQVYTSPVDLRSTDKRDHGTQVDIADGSTGHAQNNSQDRFTKSNDKSIDPSSFTKQYPVATSTPTKFDGEECSKASGGRADDQFKVHRSTPPQPGQSSFSTGRKQECIATDNQTQRLGDKPARVHFSTEYSPYKNSHHQCSPSAPYSSPAKSRQSAKPRKLSTPSRTMYAPVYDSPEAKTRPRNKIVYISRSPEPPVDRETSGDERIRKVVVRRSGSEKRKVYTKPESKQKVYLVRAPYSESDSDSGPDIEVIEGPGLQLNEVLRLAKKLKRSRLIHGSLQELTKLHKH